MGAVQARALLTTTPGRFSTQMGIDCDAGAREVERWLLGASLFGTRISGAIAVRAYRSLDSAGVSTVADSLRHRHRTLVRLLDAGGYARYDERTATRLHALARAARERFPDGVAAWGGSIADEQALVSTLDALPGWGPVTVAAFLRELRGVWPAATERAPDPRAVRAARRLGVVEPSHDLTLRALRRLAQGVGADVRDLEAALVRADLRHG